jgi:hypothetical protein
MGDPSGRKELPSVLVTTAYQTGMTLTKEAMEVVEAQRKRLPHLRKWFVDIVYSPLPLRDT